MNGDPGYALQQLELAILDLATGAGDLRSRLKYIDSSHLHVINEHAFPEELKQDWKNIKKALSKKGPVKDSEGEIFTGAVDNTLRGMKSKTATKIANDILVLRDKLRGYFEDLAQNKP